MPTANEEIFDRFVAHSIGLERYKAQVIRQLMETLNATEEDVERLLNERMGRVVEAGGYDGGPEVTRRLEDLIEDIGKVREEAFRAVNSILTEELTGLALYETSWQKALLEEVIQVELNVAMPTAEVLNAATFSRPFEGQVLKDWVEGMPEADLRRISQAIRTGVVEGETTDQITRRVLGTRGAGFADGATEGTRRGAEALARTAVNHTVTQAREETYSANADIIDLVRIVATLDGRTTMICMSLDGKVFPVREGKRPPFHWGCRTSTIPVINGVKLIGERPSVTDTRTRAKREIDFRAEAKEAAGPAWKKMTEGERREAIRRRREAWARENIGGAPKEMTYEQWLRKQSAAFQDEVLGPTRGKLFRNGGLKVERFIDASGKRLTLEQLRKEEAQAFKRAKLN